MQFSECNEIDDKQAENIMRELGVEWTVETVEIKKIDWVLTSQNHGRVNNLTPEQFEKLLADKRRGDQFPRCIYAKMPNGRYLVVSGCNRSKADKEIGAVKCSAYVIKFDPLTCRAVAIRCNAIHGHGLSMAEQLRLAVDMVDGHGLTIAGVSRIMALDESRLVKACSVARTIASLLANGTSQQVISAIPEATMYVLYRLRCKPTALKAVAQAIAAYQLGRDEIIELAKELVNTESVEQCLEKIRDAVSAKKAIKSLKKRQAPKCVTAVKSLAEMTYQQLQQLTPHDRQTLKALLPKASEWVQILQDQQN